MLTEARIAQNVARDVALSSKARVVMRLSGTRVTIKHNRASRLNVIAILGPVRLGKQHFSTALLAEVGIGHARPYARLYPLLKPIKKSVRSPQLKLAYGKVTPGRFNIPRRVQPAGLSKEQYSQLSPYLCATIQAITDETVARWTSGPVYSFYKPRTYSRGRKKNLKVPITITRDCGKVFTVSRRDHTILGDLLWASVHHPRVRSSIRKRAGYMAVRLRSTYKNAPKRMAYVDTKLFRQLKQYLDDAKYAPWLRAEILRGMAEWPKSRVWQELWDFVGAGSDPHALALIDQAQRTGNPRCRIGRLHLRSKILKSTQHYSFEVFSSDSGEVPF